MNALFSFQQFNDYVSNQEIFKRSACFIEYIHFITSVDKHFTQR
jgi:hypothetical protein